MCVFVCTHLHIHSCTHMWRHAHVCLHVMARTHTRAQTSRNAHACAQTHKCVVTYLHTYVQGAHICLCTCVHGYSHWNTLMYRNVNTHARHSCVHTPAQAYCTCTHMSTAHRHTHLHTDTWTCKATQVIFTHAGCHVSMYAVHTDICTHRCAHVCTHT